MLLLYIGAPEGNEQPQNEPGSPELIAPAGDKNTALPVYFEWSSIPDAESYQLQVSTVDSFSDTVIDIIIYGMQKCACFIELLPHTVYYWRVRALTGNAAGQFSKTGRFMTL